MLGNWRLWTFIAALLIVLLYLFGAREDVIVVHDGTEREVIVYKNVTVVEYVPTPVVEYVKVPEYINRTIVKYVNQTVIIHDNNSDKDNGNSGNNNGEEKPKYPPPRVELITISKEEKDTSPNWEDDDGNLRYVSKIFNSYNRNQWRVVFFLL